MNKRIGLKAVISLSTIVILGLIITFALGGCTSVPCPDGTEDIGIGRCVPSDSEDDD
jgi:hypothetical protein